MIDKLPISVYPDNSQVVKPAPITVLARLDDIIVLQTAAFSKASLSSAAVAATATISDADADAGNNSNAIDDANSSDAKNDQHMLAEGQSSYAALNLGLHVQDNAEQVLQNRMRLLSAINEQLASTHQ
ncbi:laccase domain-containing protein, partial [Psychrobacter urativorans]|uniref:laccase domain-containing protein n=1 Tax=Psychrobacter urativorans TaxID=45610 RepID=UPI003BB4A7DB